MSDVESAAQAAYPDAPDSPAGYDSGQHFAWQAGWSAGWVARDVEVAELRAMLAESEWEYGVSWLEGEERIYVDRDSDWEAANDLARMNLGYPYPEENFMVKRRPAGPWVPADTPTPDFESIIADNLKRSQTFCADCGKESGMVGHRGRCLADTPKEEQ